MPFSIGRFAPPIELMRSRRRSAVDGAHTAHKTRIITNTHTHIFFSLLLLSSPARIKYGTLINWSIPSSLERRQRNGNSSSRIDYSSEVRRQLWIVKNALQNDMRNENEKLIIFVVEKVWAKKARNENNNKTFFLCILHSAVVVPLVFFMLLSGCLLLMMLLCENDTESKQLKMRNSKPANRMRGIYIYL